MKKNNSLRQEMKSLGEEFLEIRRLQEKSGQRMELMVKELQRTAGQEEVQVLKRYMEYWNPLNFVTQKDLDRLLSQIRGDYGHNLKEKDKKTEIILEKKEKR